MTYSDSTDRFRNLRVPGYFILGIAVVVPLTEFLLTVSPWHPSVVQWRFGTLGLASSAIGTPLTGLFFIYALSLIADDRKVEWAIAVLASIMAVFLILGAGSFVLDALQMKARIKPQGLRPFRNASIAALLKLLIEGVAAGLLAVTAIRHLRSTRKQKVRRPADSLLVGRVGARSTPAPSAADQLAPSRSA